MEFIATHVTQAIPKTHINSSNFDNDCSVCLIGFRISVITVLPPLF